MAEYEYVQSSGVIVPDTSDTLALVQDEFRTAFGADISVSADTPQGVLITGEVLARDNVVRNNAALANQINPNMAEGKFLDAIWALTGGARRVATRSTIADVALAGVAGTIIPAGAQAKTSDGNLFETTGAAILDATGAATVDMQSVEFGPVAADASSLTLIVSSVLGWETVTNANAAVLGASTETDQAARARRRATLALQGVALPEAILSAVYATEGVKSAVFRENYTDASIVIEGVTLVEHSIYVAVDGGTDLDVATALLANKSLGAAWNGNTTVDVTEPSSGQEYEVKFTRPDAVVIYIKVTARSDAAIANPATIIREAVLAYANGELSDEPGFTVGADISAFEIAGAINRANPPIYVSKVELSLDGIAWSTDTLTITIEEIATITSGNISVVLV
jgi:hypothetical protein